MDDIYRELQAKIGELKSQTTGLADFSFTGSSMDNFFEERLSLDTEAPVFIQTSEETLTGLQQGMTNIIACLRGLYAVHHHGHRVVASEGVYQDQQVLEHISARIADEIENLADKAVGYLGHDVLNVAELSNVTHRWLREWNTVKGTMARGIQAEEDFVRVATEYITTLENSGVMDLGFGTYITAAKVAHEGYRYQLVERLAFRTSKTGRRAAEIVKASRQNRHRIRVSSLSDLDAFLMVGNVLVHKCDKDLWKLTKDADGNQVIEKLYDSDVLSY